MKPNENDGVNYTRASRTARPAGVGWRACFYTRGPNQRVSLAWWKTPGGCWTISISRPIVGEPSHTGPSGCDCLAARALRRVVSRICKHLLHSAPLGMPGLARRHAKSSFVGADAWRHLYHWASLLKLLLGCAPAIVVSQESSDAACTAYPRASGPRPGESSR